MCRTHLDQEARTAVWSVEQKFLTKYALRKSGVVLRAMQITVLPLPAIQTVYIRCIELGDAYGFGECAVKQMKTHESYGSKNFIMTLTYKYGTLTIICIVSVSCSPLRKGHTSTKACAAFRYHT